MDSLRGFVMYTFAFVLKIIALLLPKVRNQVLFGSSNGKRFSDNSAVLFKYILDNHPDLKVIWLTNSEKVIEEVTKAGGVAFKRRSIMGVWKTLVSPIYITSHSIKDVTMFIPLLKRPKHIYLHHGIPMRRGWFDIKGASPKSMKSTKNKIRVSNHMIAPSIFAAKDQNKLIPIGIEKFEITGLPRTDVFFNKDFDQYKFKQKYALESFDKLILYAPTWRPWGTTQFFPFQDLDFEQLETFLNESNSCIILRPHHIDLERKENASFWKKIRSSSRMKIINHDICQDVNKLCIIADALITDYSSIYYDFLILDKPVVFIPYDYKRYNKEIGFYQEYEKITIGSKPESQLDFIKVLKDEIIDGNDTFGLERNRLKEKFYQHLDGQSSERVTQLIKNLIS